MAEIGVKPVYVVISQTGTVLSRILKLITHKEYNHASLSFCDDLHIMYSFGRKNPYNPFWAGFVKESASFGTFKRFSEARVVVLKFNLTETEYESMRSAVEYMASHPEDYGYNYFGLWFAAFNICVKSDKRYYCSEFVRDMLIKYNVNEADRIDSIVHPMHFTQLPDAQEVFCGRLRDFGLHNKQTV